MGTPAAFGGQIGWKSESTFGTGVTVDQFHAGFLSESITKDVERIPSRGKIAGRYVENAWVPGRVTVGGNVELELWDEPAATLLTHMFGTVNTTGAGPYTHTATPGDLTDKSLTIEVGKPDTGGTVRSFVYDGCKFAGWELSCSVGDIPTLSLDVTAQDETTGGTLATASYPTAAPFVFTQASITIAGSEVATVTDASLSADSNLASDRHFLGTNVIGQQYDQGMRTFGGTVNAEFESLTAYNRFVNGTEAALVYTIDNATDSLTITCNVRFNGDTPTVPTDGLLAQSLPYMCTSGTSDAAAITAVLVNAESSAA